MSLCVLIGDVKFCLFFKQALYPMWGLYDPGIKSHVLYRLSQSHTPGDANFYHLLKVLPNFGFYFSFAIIKQM